MRIHNVTAVPLAYDLEGHQVEGHTAVDVKMNPVLQELLDSGKVITVQEAANTVVSESRKAGHKATQERDQ